MRSSNISNPSDDVALVLAPPSTDAVRELALAKLARCTFRGVPVEVVDQLTNAHVLPYLIMGITAYSVVDTMRRGINFAIANCVPSMRVELHALVDQFIELCGAISLQNARSRMALSMFLTRMNTDVSPDQLTALAKALLKKFTEVRFAEIQLTKLKVAISVMAAKCIAVGSNVVIAEEQNVRSLLTAYENALFDEQLQRGTVEMLDGQIAFLKRPDVKAEEYKSRVTWLGKVLQDLHVKKANVPPNVDSTTTSSSGWFIFHSSSRSSVRINNDHQRQVYQSEIDLLNQTIRELGDAANASDAAKALQIAALEERQVQAKAKLARAEATVKDAKQNYEDANETLRELMSKLEVRNSNTLKTLVALGQGLNDSIEPILRFAATIQTSGEALVLARDQYHKSIFLSTIAQYAVLAAGFDGTDLIMLEDTRFGRALMELEGMNHAREERFPGVPEPMRAPDFI